MVGVRRRQADRDAAAARRGVHGEGARRLGARDVRERRRRSRTAPRRSRSSGKLDETVAAHARARPAAGARQQPAAASCCGPRGSSRCRARARGRCSSCARSCRSRTSTSYIVGAKPEVAGGLPARGHRRAVVRARRRHGEHRELTGGLRRSLATFAVAALALASGAAATTAAVARPAAGCTDPVVHDRYDGFHLGIPAGWSLAVADGFIVVHQDPVGSIESVVDPALLAKGQTPAKFFQVAAAALKKDVAGAGNAMSFQQTGATTASLTGRAGTIPVTGQASVSVLPYPSAHGSQLAVFSAYWAPPAKLAGAAPLARRDRRRATAPRPGRSSASSRTRRSRTRCRPAGGCRSSPTSSPRSTARWRRRPTSSCRRSPPRRPA